jgi:hypothetical protein
MAGAWAMASLAGDIYIGPAGGISIGGEVIVLFQIRGMAACTLIVPGLVAPGPMKAVTGSQDLVRVKGKPALATLLLRTAVPGDPERLIAAARKGDQILLERSDAEGVGDFIVVRRPVRTLGPHHELVATAGECGRQSVMGQRGIGEIAENRGCCCLLHGEGMMRSLPALGLRHMATGASLGANECGSVREGRRHHRQPEEQRGEPTRLHWRPLNERPNRGSGR